MLTLTAADISLTAHCHFCKLYGIIKLRCIRMCFKAGTVQLSTTSVRR